MTTQNVRLTSRTTAAVIGTCMRVGVVSENGRQAKSVAWMLTGAVEYVLPSDVEWSLGAPQLVGVVPAHGVPGMVYVFDIELTNVGDKQAAATAVLEAVSCRINEPAEG